MSSHNIESAGLFINNSLISKGYIQDSGRLYFGDDGKRNEKNDTRIINTIYALLNTIENDLRIKESNNKRINDLEKELEREIVNKNRLEVKLEGVEKQLNSFQRSNNNFELALQDERKKCHDLRENLLKFQNSIQQLKLQTSNELRRKDMELAWLRERIRDPRRASKSFNEFSSKLPTAISGSLVSKELVGGGGGGGVDGGNNQFKLHNELNSINVVLSGELTSFNSKLISENKVLLSLVDKVKSSINGLTQGNSNISSVKISNGNDSAGVVLRTADTEVLGNDVLSSISQIRDILNSPNFVSLAELKEKEKVIESLKDQLKEVTVNWEKALKTMDEWKSYREHRGGKGSGDKDRNRRSADREKKREVSEKGGREKEVDNEREKEKENKIEKPTIKENTEKPTIIQNNNYKIDKTDKTDKPTYTGYTRTVPTPFTTTIPVTSEKSISRPKLTSLPLTPKGEKYKRLSKFGKPTVSIVAPVAPVLAKSGEIEVPPATVKDQVISTPTAASSLQSPSDD